MSGTLPEIEILQKQFFDTSLKFAQRKEVRGKKIFVFSDERSESGSTEIAGGWGEYSASLPDRNIYFFD